MSERTWIVATILSALVVIGFISLTAWRNASELEQARAALEEARQSAEQAARQTEEVKRALGQSRARLEQLQKETEAASQTHVSLEQEMRAALESKDVTISELQGKLTVNILDRVMFDSGEAVLKSGGEGVLQKVAQLLAQHPELKIHVIGHTDNVPIRASARQRFPSNWELSTARATAAVRFLTETAGVDARRVGAVGYGEFRPVADNTTPEGRAKNRRIAITVLSEELAGADTGPTKPAPAGENADGARVTNAPANSTPAQPEPETPPSFPGPR